MPPSSTTGSPPAACAQFFTDDASLRRQFTGSALPSIPSSASDGEEFSGLYYGSLSLRPIDLLASLADLTRFSPSQRRLLLPSFPRVGRPSLGRVSLRWQLSKLHRWVSHPLELQLALLHELILLLALACRVSRSFPTAFACPLLRPTAAADFSVTQLLAVLQIP